MKREALTVQQVVNAPVEKVWDYWTRPEHITQWNNASDDWYTPRAESDVRNGGRFTYRMEARDGSVGFDFGGTYNTVTPHQLLEYTLDDGRKVWIEFSPEGNGTKVVERFEPDTHHPAEMQQAGWQAIMDNFKTYTESH
jgi:uncharacterized protein YndB with AHSA1/START domain